MATGLLTNVRYAPMLTVVIFTTCLCFADSITSPDPAEEAARQRAMGTYFNIRMYDEIQKSPFALQFNMSAKQAFVIASSEENQRWLAQRTPEQRNLFFLGHPDIKTDHDRARLGAALEQLGVIGDADVLPKGFAKVLGQLPGIGFVADQAYEQIYKGYEGIPQELGIFWDYPDRRFDNVPAGEALYALLAKMNVERSVDPVLREYYTELHRTEFNVSLSADDDPTKGQLWANDKIHKEMKGNLAQADLKEFKNSCDTLGANYEAVLTRNRNRQRSDSRRVDAAIDTLVTIEVYLRHLKTAETERRENERYELKWKAAMDVVQLASNVLRATGNPDAIQIARGAEAGYEVGKSIVDFGKRVKKLNPDDLLVANPFGILKAVFKFASIFGNGKSEVQILQEWLATQFTELREELREHFTMLYGQIEGLDRKLDQVLRKLDSIEYKLARQHALLTQVHGTTADVRDDTQEILRVLQADRWATYENQYAELWSACFNSGGQHFDDPDATILQFYEHINYWSMARDLNGHPEQRDLKIEGYANKVQLLQAPQTQGFFQNTGNLLFLERYYRAFINDGHAPMDLRRLGGIENLTRTRRLDVEASSDVPIRIEYIAVHPKHQDAYPNPLVLKDAASGLIELLKQHPWEKLKPESQRRLLEALAIVRDQMQAMHRMTAGITADHVTRAIDYNTDCLRALIGSAGDRWSGLDAAEKSFVNEYLGFANQSGPTNAGRATEKLVRGQNVTINLLETDSDGLPVIRFNEAAPRTDYWCAALEPGEVATTTAIPGGLPLEGHELGRHLPQNLREMLLLLDARDPVTPTVRFLYDIRPTEEFFEDDLGSMLADLIQLPGGVADQYRWQKYHLEFSIVVPALLAPERGGQRTEATVFRGHMPFAMRVARKRHIHWAQGDWEDSQGNRQSRIYSDPEWDNVRYDPFQTIGNVFLSQIWLSDQYHSREYTGDNERTKKRWDWLPRELVLPRTPHKMPPIMLEDPPIEKPRVPNPTGNLAFGFRKSGAPHLLNEQYKLYVNLRQRLATTANALIDIRDEAEKRNADDTIDFFIQLAKFRLRSQFIDKIKQGMERRDGGILGEGFYPAYHTARSSISFLDNMLEITFQEELRDESHRIHCIRFKSIGPDLRHEFARAQLPPYTPPPLDIELPCDEMHRREMNHRVMCCEFDVEWIDTISLDAQRELYSFVKDLRGSQVSTSEPPIEVVIVCWSDLLRFLDDRIAPRLLSTQAPPEFQQVGRIWLESMRRVLVRLAELHEACDDLNAELNEVCGRGGVEGFVAAELSQRENKLILTIQQCRREYDVLASGREVFDLLQQESDSTEPQTPQELVLRERLREARRSWRSRLVNEAGRLGEGVRCFNRTPNQKTPKRIALVGDRDLAEYVAQGRFSELREMVDGHIIAGEVLKEEVKKLFDSRDRTRGNAEYMREIEALEFLLNERIAPPGP